MARKQMTIEDLALIVQKGFAETATKTGLHDLRKDLSDRMDLIEGDLRDLKITMGPLVRIVAAQENNLRSLNLRVNRLERKAGFTK